MDVQQRPLEYTEHAIDFLDTDPTYNSGLISGFSHAVKDDKEIIWENVLNLCDSIVEKPKEIEGREIEIGDTDPDWEWTRQEIARLLELSYTNIKYPCPFELRELSWNILMPLTEDSNPTDEYESQYGDKNMDYATLSINTVRGVALHAVIHYSLWCYRNINDTDEKIETSNWFDNIPEAKAVLERHLEKKYDPSLAIHSIYGQFYPYLAFIDKNWAKKNISKIFPREENLIKYRHAAWSSYVIFNKMYNEVFNTLKDEYVFSLKNEGILNVQLKLLADPANKTAEHIIVAYLRKKIEIDDILIVNLSEKRMASVASHVMNFIGRNIKELFSYDDLKKNIIDYWEKRLSAIKEEGDIAIRKNELSNLSWWFEAENIDDEWLFNNLKEILALKVKPEHGRYILKRMEKCIANPNIDVLSPLKQLIILDDEGWMISTNDEHIRNILEPILESTNDSRKEEAREVIDLLGAKGHIEFMDLIK